MPSVAVDAELLRRTFGLFELSLVDPDEALRAATRCFMEVVRAQNGFVMFAARRGTVARRRSDPMEGIRIQTYYRVNPISPAGAKLVASILRSVDYVNDPLVQARAARREKLWFERNRSLPVAGDARSRALWQALGACDQLIGALSFGTRASFHFGFERAKGKRRFHASDVERGRQFLSVLEPLFRRIAAWHGVFDGRVLLSPRETEAFRALLGPRSEKQIAHDLGLTTRSTHQLVGSIYRKLAVQGRVELLRRWMDGR